MMWLFRIARGWLENGVTSIKRNTREYANTEAAFNMAKARFVFSESYERLFMDGYEKGYKKVKKYRGEFEEIILGWKEERRNKGAYSREFYRVYTTGLLQDTGNIYRSIEKTKITMRKKELATLMGEELGNTLAYLSEFLGPFGNDLIAMRNEHTLRNNEILVKKKKEFHSNSYFRENVADIFLHRLEGIRKENEKQGENRLLLELVAYLEKGLKASKDSPESL